jgi:cell division protein FtsB
MPYVHGRADPHTTPDSPRRRLRFRPAYLILLIFLALFSYKFLEKTQQIRALARQEAALRQQNDQTARENTALQRAIQFYRTPAYVEEQAREIYGDSNPGDILVQSNPVFERPVPVVRAAPPLPRATPEPAWKQWWRAFFGR